MAQSLRIVKIKVCSWGKVVSGEDLASRRGARRPGPARSLAEIQRQMKMVRLPPWNPWGRNPPWRKLLCWNPP